MLWEIFSVTASLSWQLVCALYPAVAEVGVCSRELTSTFSRLCHHADVTKQQLEEELKQLDAELHRLQEVASSAKTLRWGVSLALCALCVCILVPMSIYVCVMGVCVWYAFLCVCMCVCSCGVCACVCVHVVCVCVHVW